MMQNTTWDILKPYEQTTEFQAFLHQIDQLYETRYCTPKKDNIFKALQMTPYEKVKVVILGQDPYPKKRSCYRSCILCIGHLSYPIIVTKYHQRASIRIWIRNSKHNGFDTMGKTRCFIVEHSLNERNWRKRCSPKYRMGSIYRPYYSIGFSKSDTCCLSLMGQ